MHPILFEIGPVSIRSYGVLVALAFFTGFALLYKEARRRDFYADKILDIELVILISGVIGARMLHVLVNLDFYREDLLRILFIWNGGLAFQGGLVLAILASLVFILKNRLPLWKTADFIIPYIALGQSIGRLGCFFNGCCFGRGTHATQLYAAIALLIIFIILRSVHERPPFSGFAFGLYLFLFSFQRFFIDFLRADLPRHMFDLTVPQMISAVIFVIALFLFLLLPKKR
jgi:phosphatidylglycerol:prolipoprotein diacylglycerol transferase